MTKTFTFKLIEWIFLMQNFLHYKKKTECVFIWLIKTKSFSIWLKILLVLVLNSMKKYNYLTERGFLPPTPSIEQRPHRSIRFFRFMNILWPEWFFFHLIQITLECYPFHSYCPSIYRMCVGRWMLASRILRMFSALLANASKREEKNKFFGAKLKITFSVHFFFV